MQQQIIEQVIRECIQELFNNGTLPAVELPEDFLERPRDKSFGDWACTLALKLAKPLRRPPREVAELLADALCADPHFAVVEIAGPGFINLTLTAQTLQQEIITARQQGLGFARNNSGAGQRVNVEFISANPTGPMHVGHGRWAALGNAICNLLEHSGWQVTREFYINDAGHQMDVFAHSVWLRYQELLGVAIQPPAEFYGGSYVRDIAQQILEDEGPVWQVESAAAQDAAAADLAAPSTPAPAAPITTALTSATPAVPAAPPPANPAAPAGPAGPPTPANPATPAGPPTPIASSAPSTTAPSAPALAHFKDRAYHLMLANMQELCTRVGVRFDCWFSEQQLYQAAAGGSSAIQRLLERLRQAGYLYEQDGALWFSSTQFGDDKDRVLVKSDGSYTYFCPDIAYHLDKLERSGGSSWLVDIWGADHHGYIARMQAALAALGHAGCLTVLLGQLVNLFRDGAAVRMSKRTGEMVTFAELVDEVGADATKYLMLQRASDQPIDFDIDTAQRADASNPVYYVQYAHARICSLLRKTTEQGLTASAAGLAELTDPSELELARCFGRLPELIESAARDLAPHRLTHYAEDLAQAFHSFYTRCPVLGSPPQLAAARLYLADATRSVLELVLGLLGVSAPEQM